MTTSTFAQATPTRPGLADVGGGDKLASSQGDPKRSLLPEEANQLALQSVAAGGIIPVALLTMRLSGSAYMIDKIASTNPNLTLLTAATLLSVTKNGTGDVTITWGANVLPSPVADPMVTCLGTTPLLVACEALTLGARIRMKSDAGAATDGSFLLAVY